MESTTKVRKELIDNYGRIVGGLCTPEEFADIVIEDIVANEMQSVNLDYHDVTSSLRNASAADAVRVSGSKAEIRQLLEKAMEMLCAAHPHMEIGTMLVNLQAPTGDLMTDDVSVFGEFFGQFGDININWGMTNRGNPGDAIQITAVAGFKQPCL